MVNKRLIDQICTILILLDLVLGLFFLAFLLAYTLSDGGGFILNNPLVYVTMALLFIIPICYMTYFLLINKEKEESAFIFNRESFLNVKKINNQKEDKENYRFSKLYEIDNMKKEEVKFDKITSLKSFCDNFRNYCASNLSLYYEISDIRAFIANLAISKIMILQGMSGTGKTSIALAFEKYIGNVLEPVAIQPMWKERSDLVGYFNEFTKKFNETLLLEELYKSNLDDKIYIIILDEVNIARIEYYFAEFLSLLEYPDEDRRTLEITNDTWINDPKMLKEGKLLIKNNVYFLGTANNDESTFAISDKVYDRSMILNLNKKATPFRGEKVGETKISNTEFMNICQNKIRAFKNSEEYKEILSSLNKIDELLNKNFKINFGNRMVNQILNYIPVYVECGGKKEEAFDDFIAKKILRKIESKDFLRLAPAIRKFLEQLDDYFGKDAMPLSREYLSRFIN